MRTFSNSSDRSSSHRSSPADDDKPITAGSPEIGLPRLNEKQLAARWGVSVRTLQAARMKGSGAPFLRIGRAVRYRMEDVLAYEEAHRLTDTSEKPR